MNLLDNRDELLKVLGKYKKEVILKDGDSEIKVILTYPKLKNSISFWDTVISLTNMYDKMNIKDKIITTGESMEMSRETLEPLTNYICGCIENEMDRDLSTDEQAIIYIYVMKNYQILTEEFATLFGALFKSGVNEKKQ